MPPRPITLAIVVFWLAMMSWLFYREVRPRLLRGEPPGFSLSKMDETKGLHPEGFWAVSRNGQEGVYTLKISHSYKEKDDSFEFVAELKHLEGKGDNSASLPIQELVTENTYTVDRQGRMQKLGLKSNYQLGRKGEALETHVELTGESSDRRFTPIARISTPGLKELFKGADRDRPLEPVDVSWHGLVLNPFHPMARIPDLKGGESWSMPTIDPFCLTEVVSVLAEGDARLKPLAAFVARRVASGSSMPASTRTFPYSSSRKARKYGITSAAAFSTRARNRQSWRSLPGCRSATAR